MNNGERFAVAQGNFKIADRQIAASAEEFCAGQCGAHLEAGEASGLCCDLACIEEKGADAVARPVGMNKEGADFGGVLTRGEEVVVPIGPLVGAVEGFAFAPAAAGDADWLGL